MLTFVLDDELSHTYVDEIHIFPPRFWRELLESDVTPGRNMKEAFFLAASQTTAGVFVHCVLLAIPGGSHLRPLISQCTSCEEAPASVVFGVLRVQWRNMQP